MTPLDDFDTPQGDLSETATDHTEALVRARERLVQTRHGKIPCREIAPNTYLGLIPERRRLSLLQIDENLFVFAPARLSRERLEHLITHLLTRHGTAPLPEA